MILKSKTGLIIFQYVFFYILLQTIHNFLNPNKYYLAVLLLLVLFLASICGTFSSLLLLALNKIFQKNETLDVQVLRYCAIASTTITTMIILGFVGFLGAV